MNAWPLLVTSDGSPTLVHPGHGEACHSRTGAWTEARERYARACRLRERARELAEDGEREFRLLDVGTGLGLNLAAAIEALDGTGLTLDAVSLELESSVIERTLLLARAGELHASSPAELVRAHAPVLDALGRVLAARERAPGRGARVWGAPEGVEAERVAPTRVAPELASPAHASDEQASAERVPPERVAMGDGRLLLLLGDGRVTLPALPRELRFDAVFLDAFSPGVDGALWQPAFLAELARRMAPGAILSTYSVSLSVRAGLAAPVLLHRAREPRALGSSPRRASHRRSAPRMHVFALMGLQEWWPILLIALLLFGGSKLPQLARAMGSSVNEFKQGMAKGMHDKEPTEKPAETPTKGN
ncbi:MAG: twin-arginine translocase TatA/TatE family subunit [Planctomycetes bacterium]|nr:twin-arginine translocase TatA/TatE family subunit [Planctomycetota bacterium]